MKTRETGVNEEQEEAKKPSVPLTSETRTQLFSELPRILPNELLIPPHFSIEVTQELLQEKIGAGYPGYPVPSERMQMTSHQLAMWKHSGFPEETIAQVSLDTHPNYLDGVARGKATLDNDQASFSREQWRKSYTGQLDFDSKNRPLHPYSALLLKSGLGISKMGWYWEEGPNLTEDGVILRERYDEKTGQRILQILVVVRTDTGRMALPGGMVESQNGTLQDVVDETLQEAGLDISSSRLEVVYKGPVADPRTTLHAWPETQVVLVHLDPNDAWEELSSIDDGAREPHWIDATEHNLQQLFASHRDFAMAGIRRWENSLDVAVDRYAGIGIPTVPLYDAVSPVEYVGDKSPFQIEQEWAEQRRIKFEEEAILCFLPDSRLTDVQIEKFTQCANGRELAPESHPVLRTYFQLLSRCILNHHHISFADSTSAVGFGTEHRPFHTFLDLNAIGRHARDISDISGKRISFSFNGLILWTDAEARKVGVTGISSVQARIALNILEQSLGYKKNQEE